MKKCSACAEEIQDAALKCRFCGEAQKPILEQADITAASEEINALLSQGDKSEALALSIQLRDRIQGAANQADFAKYQAGTESAIIALSKSPRNPVHIMAGGIMLLTLMVVMLSLRSHPGDRSQAINNRIHQAGDSEKTAASPTAVPVEPPPVVATPSPIVMVAVVVPTSTPTPLISADYLASGRKAFDGLRGLQSIVQVGISHQAYPTRLQDCQILVDRFLQDNSNEQIPGLGLEIKQAMACYNDANTVWAIKFQGERLQNFVTDENYDFSALCRAYPNLKADLAITKCEFGYHIDTAISVLWGYADGHVNAIREMLDRASAR